MSSFKISASCFVTFSTGGLQTFISMYQKYGSARDSEIKFWNMTSMKKNRAGLGAKWQAELVGDSREILRNMKTFLRDSWEHLEKCLLSVIA